MKKMPFSNIHRIIIFTKYVTAPTAASLQEICKSMCVQYIHKTT